MQGGVQAGALHAAKYGPAGAMVGVAVEGQGKFDSSSPAALTADLLGGMSPPR